MDDSADIVRNTVAEQAQRFLGGHGDDLDAAPLWDATSGALEDGRG